MRGTRLVDHRRSAPWPTRPQWSYWLDGCGYHAPFFSAGSSTMASSGAGFCSCRASSGGAPLLRFVLSADQHWHRLAVKRLDDAVARRRPGNSTIASPQASCNSRSMGYRHS